MTALCLFLEKRYFLDLLSKKQISEIFVICLIIPACRVEKLGVIIATRACSDKAVNNYGIRVDV